MLCCVDAHGPTFLLTFRHDVCVCGESLCVCVIPCYHWRTYLIGVIISCKLKLILQYKYRKFCDIGNTVRYQYLNEGYHLTSGWAELVTCHAIPGPGVLKALKEVSSAGDGCVLVAEMSSEDTLATGEYTNRKFPQNLQRLSLWGTYGI